MADFSGRESLRDPGQPPGGHRVREMAAGALSVYNAGLGLPRRKT
jgi:hypothetical protein